MGLVSWVKVLPIIATMAINYSLLTMPMMSNRGFADFVVNPLLASFTRAKILGLPLLVYEVLLLTFIIHLILARTNYGRSCFWL